MQPCPCCPQKTYKECCFPFHIGEKTPRTPLELMKSRYSAYALGLSDYIIETTHPKNPQYEKDHINWALSIEGFCRETLFLRLDILEHTEGKSEGFVTFNAILERQGKNASFQERSKFLYEDGKWLYYSGKTKSL